MLTWDHSSGRLLEIAEMYETVAFAVRTTTSPSALSDPVVVREVPIHTIQVAHQQPLGKHLKLPGPHLSTDC